MKRWLHPLLSEVRRAILAGSGLGDPSSLVPKTETDRSSASPSVPDPATVRSRVLSPQPQTQRIEANAATAGRLVILITRALIAFQKLELRNLGVVVLSYPYRHRGRRIIHVDSGECSYSRWGASASSLFRLPDRDEIHSRLPSLRTTPRRFCLE